RGSGAPRGRAAAPSPCSRARSWTAAATPRSTCPDASFPVPGTSGDIAALATSRVAAPGDGPPGARHLYDASGLDQAVADRVPRQLDAVAQVQLREQVLAVPVDGARADHEDLGDLLRGVPLGDQGEDLRLAIGELPLERLLRPCVAEQQVLGVGVEE